MGWTTVGSCLLAMFAGVPLLVVGTCGMILKSGHWGGIVTFLLFCITYSILASVFIFQYRLVKPLLIPEAEQEQFSFLFVYAFAPLYGTAGTDALSRILLRHGAN